MPTPSKLNLRLPPDLRAQADALAEHLGLSLNALCVMALRNFVDWQASKRPPTARAGLQATTAPPRTAPKVSQVQDVPKVGRNDPCPCGSGQKFKRCHGASPTP